MNIREIMMRDKLKRMSAEDMKELIVAQDKEIRKDNAVFVLLFGIGLLLFGIGLFFLIINSAVFL